MASDDLKIHFHLTCEGWIRGTSWFYGEVQAAVVERPKNTVATFELHLTQSSDWAPEKRKWKEIWRSTEVLSVELENYLSEYAPPDENTTNI